MLLAQVANLENEDFRSPTVSIFDKWRGKLATGPFNSKMTFSKLGW